MCQVSIQFACIGSDTCVIQNKNDTLFSKSLDKKCEVSKMNIGPTELIIIGILCCIPVVIVAVAAIVVVIVKYTSKDSSTNS